MLSTSKKVESVVRYLERAANKLVMLVKNAGLYVRFPGGEQKCISMYLYVPDILKGAMC